MIAPLDTSARVGAVPYLSMLSAALRSRGLLASFLPSLLIALIVLIVGSLWKAAIAPHGTVLGFSAAMMVWYLAMAESAVVSVNPRMVQIQGQRIRSGEVLATLTRPVHLVWAICAEELGAAFERVAWLLVLTSGAALLLVGLPPAPASMLTLLVTLPLAIALNVVLTMLAVGACFWLGGERSVSFVYQKFFFFGGGMLLPLSFLPSPADQVLTMLPWAGTAYIPAFLAVSDRPLDHVWLIGLQAGWLVVAGLGMVALFRRGERKLVTEGG